jgi:hypothetical protein
VIAIVIFALCVASLGKATGLFGTTTKEDLGHVVAVFGVGLSVICGLLWAADAANLLTLRKGLRTTLWSTLIVSVLAATVAAYKGYFSSPAVRSRVGIDSLRLVKEGDQAEALPDTIELRPNQMYYGATAPIAFVTCFSGLELDAMGKFDAELIIAVVNEARGVAEYAAVDIRESPAQWKSRVSEPRSRQIRELRGGCTGNIQYAALLGDRTDIGTGSLKLRFTVTDRLTGFTDTKTAVLVIKPMPVPSTRTGAPSS